MCAYAHQEASLIVLSRRSSCSTRALVPFSYGGGGGMGWSRCFRRNKRVGHGVFGENKRVGHGVFGETSGWVTVFSGKQAAAPVEDWEATATAAFCHRSFDHTARTSCSKGISTCKASTTLCHRRSMTHGTILLNFSCGPLRTVATESAPIQVSFWNRHLGKGRSPCDAEPPSTATPKNQTNGGA